MGVIFRGKEIIMSKVVYLEIRDRMTFIPAMAILLVSETEKGRKILRRAGYSQIHHSVYLVHLSSGVGHNDAYGWDGVGRTMHEAHLHIEKMFPVLKDGDVVDIEFIKGESETMKKSELE